MAKLHERLASRPTKGWIPMKKLIALLLASALLLTLAGALADDAPASFKIKAGASDIPHTYEIFQIFTGDYADGKLTDARWGQNGSGTVGTLVGEDTLDSLAAVNGSASDVAKLPAITACWNKSSAPFATIKTGESATAPVGYYLIRDKHASLEGKDDAATTYIVTVTSTDVTIRPKSAKPTVDKEVWDEAADAETPGQSWGESADHAVNETFQFRLTATLPADPDFASYDKYRLVFEDTQSEGVTFEKIVSVKVNGKDVAAADYACTATAGQAGGSWSLTVYDIVPYVSSMTGGVTVQVVYDAHLNEHAQVDASSVESTTNKNTVFLRYSNNPNATGNGKHDSSDKPEMGKTVEDHVWVFTYQVDVAKINGKTDAKLAGVTFELRDSRGKKVGLTKGTDGAYWADPNGTDELVTDENGALLVKGLDAGTYKLRETKPLPGYNPCPDVTIIITAKHAEAEGGQSAANSLNGSENMAVTVKNYEGALLPTTGGIGTTVLYVAGTLLILGAAALLIVRSRKTRS